MNMEDEQRCPHFPKMSLSCQWVFWQSLCSIYKNTHTNYVSFAVQKFCCHSFYTTKRHWSAPSKHDEKDLTALFSAVLVWFVWLKPEVTPQRRDIISSFISEPRPIRRLLIGSLNKTLIVLHFLGTCVKDHSMIKNKCVSVVFTHISKPKRAILSLKWKFPTV